MKKKWILCALLAALCLCAHACAEDGFWTRRLDFYYHANSNCMGESGMVPISEEAALAFSKLACPICVQAADDGADVRAVSRGGTIVVRFSDAWLDAQELIGVFGWSTADQYTGKQADRKLGEYLHGDAYNAFLRQCSAAGSAEGRADTPHILATDGSLVMSKRHIGSAWYIVLRPKQAFGREWSMYWRVSSHAIQMENGVLSIDFDLQTVEETRSLKLNRMDDSQSIYERSGDDLQMAVYRALDGNVAVIWNRGIADAENAETLLCIEGAAENIAMNGYTENGAQVYCCMLTDGELQALQRNARAEIIYVEEVDERLYRRVEQDQYVYCARETDEALFSIERADGVDPVDNDFHLIAGGLPSDDISFVVQTVGADYLMDDQGARYDLDADLPPADRITPLIWHADGGVFLVEGYTGLQNYFSVGERLSEKELGFGVEYQDPNAEAMRKKHNSSYYCYLIDEKAQPIGSESFCAFTLYENGEIRMRNSAGELRSFGPYPIVE